MRRVFVPIHHCYTVLSTLSMVCRIGLEDMQAKILISRPPRLEKKSPARGMVQAAILRIHKRPVGTVGDPSRLFSQKVVFGNSGTTKKRHRHDYMCSFRVNRLLGTLHCIPALPNVRWQHSCASQAWAFQPPRARATWTMCSMNVLYNVSGLEFALSTPVSVSQNSHVSSTSNASYFNNFKCYSGLPCMTSQSWGYADADRNMHSGNQWWFNTALPDNGQSTRAFGSLATLILTLAMP